MAFLHLHILTDSNIAALKAEAHALGTAAASTLAAAVTLVAQAGNPIGAATLAAVTVAESTTLTGAEKKAQVVAAVAPVVIAEAGKGSLAVIAKDAETFAGLVVEEVVAMLKRTPLVAIGEALLHALGVA